MKGTLTANEQEYFDARNAIIEAGLAKEDAEWARYEQERKKSLDQAMREYLTEYGEGLAITEDYQEQIDKARAAGEEGKALLLERQMQEALSNAKLKNLKRSSEYVRAFEDLSNASSETLKSLIAKFEAAKESAAQNLTPDQLREYTSTLQQMYDELDSRNPFDTLAKSIRELAAAQDEVKSAQDIYKKVMAGETVINMATGNAYTEEEAVKRLTAAKDNEAKVYTKLTKAATSCASRLNSFAGTLNNLGDMVGGKLGDTLGAFGNMLGSIGGAFDNIKNINVNATGLEKMMGQVSAVAGTVSAMVEMNRQLDSILPDQESLYEHYAAKQREINEKRQQILELEIEQLNERLNNEHWFYENGLTQLRKNAELNAEYAKAYGEIASAPQEVYKEAKSGFSKWAPAIIGAIVGIVAGVLTFGAGAGAGAALGAAIGSAIGGTAIGAALGSTVIAMIGTAVFSGVGAALGNAVRAGIDGIMYDPNQTAAINNMRVQTRHKTFFRSEKTQNLEDWVKENWGQSLFEEIKGVKLIDPEVARKILEEGPTLVGETRETLESLVEYSEKIHQFLDEVHEYVSQAFSPLVNNLVDALWDWLTNGKNVLDSFREYAADTFKGIAQDALKAMANKLIFEPFQEQLENLTIAYSTNQIDETAYMAGVSAFAAQAQETIEKNLPAMQNAAEVMQQAFEAVGISITGIGSESINTFSDMKEAFKSALLDMEEDAEDFKKYLTEMLIQKALDVPVTVNGQTFKDFDEYFADWQKRVSASMDAPVPETIDVKVSDIEAEIAKLERRKHTAQIASYQKSLDALDARWGLFSRNAGVQESSMSEEQIKAYHSMLSLQESINKLKADDVEIEAKIAELREKIKVLNETESLTEEERAAKLKEYEKELNDVLATTQKIAKTYADMTGWTLEEKIDASALANIGDSLLSALQDTSKSVEDWKKEIVKAMTDDLIKEVVYNQEFKDKMRQFQEWYIAIMTGENLYNTDAEGNKIKLDIDFDFTNPEGVAAALQWLADQMAQTATAAAEDADKINAAMGQIGGNNDESPFDGLRDSFFSALTDMEGDAESFKRKLQETLVKDLMDRQVLGVPLTVTIDGEDIVFDNFDKFSENWNKRYLDAVKSGNTELADALINELMRVYGLTMQQAEGLRERLKEIAKDTTFKDMTNNWVSNLMDFNATAEDWAEGIGRTMAQKIIEQMIVPTLIQPLLDNLQTAFDTAMSEHGEYGTDWDWKKVIGADGVQEALQAINAAYPELKETITAILAALNITPVAEDAKEAFNDLTGTIISGLTDAEMTAEEFSKNIARTLIEQLMKQIVESQFAETMKGIQEDWAKALESGDTSAIEAIRQRIVQLYKDAGRATDELRGIFEEVKEGDTTFKDMADSWVSALFDMDSTASDFGRQIGRTLVEKLVKELVVTKQLQKYLDDIQTAFDNAIGKEGATIESVLAAVTPAINAAVAATEQWKPVIEEISKAFQEIDKSTPLDNIRSNFLSQLMDMKSDTKDFARSINEILTEAFIDKFVLGEEFDKKLEEWKKEYASIMGGNYSEKERANLLKQLRQAIKTAEEGYAAEAKAIHELMGTANYADQSATMNMADKITYEQADQLLGINMAQELTLEQILATLQGGTISGVRGSDIYQQMYDTSHNDDTAKQILAVLRNMSSITSVGNGDGYGEQIFNRLGTTNDYLRVIRDEVKSYLGSIAMYTANLVKL